jgi:hypothetical protein
MAETKVETDQYRITRETRAKSQHEYDFVLYDFENGEEVITATEIEFQADVHFEDIDNWTSVLTTFADNYVETKSVDDALTAVTDEYL